MYIRITSGAQYYQESGALVLENWQVQEAPVACQQEPWCRNHLCVAAVMTLRSRKICYFLRIQSPKKQSWWTEFWFYAHSLPIPRVQKKFEIFFFPGWKQSELGNFPKGLLEFWASPKGDVRVLMELEGQKWQMSSVILILLLEKRLSRWVILATRIMIRWKEVWGMV